MRNKEIKLGIVLSYFQMGLGIIISLIYTPLMIRFLGKSEYGLYNTVASTISMMSILSLGFNSSYIRYYIKYKKNNDIENINKLNGLYLVIFTIIGLIACFCGIFLSLNLRYVFKDGLSNTEYITAKTLMILLTCNLSFSFPMSVFSNIISAHERFIFLKTLLLLKTVFSPLLSIPLLYFGYGSIAIVFSTIFVSLVTDLLYLFYCVKILRVKFCFRNFEKGLFKDILFFTSFIAINMIVDQINLNVDKILLGRFKGTEIVAIYSVGFTLFIYFQQFSTSISSLFAPSIHSMANKFEGMTNDYYFTDVFVKVGRIQLMILGLLCTGFIFFGRSFIYFWAGNGYDEAYFVMLLLCVSSIVPLSQNIGVEVQRSLNKHKFRSIVYLLMALINIVLSIILCQLYGAIGCAIGTAISFIIANGIIMNVYYYKKCKINIFSYWKSFLKISCGLVIPCVCGFLMKSFFPQNTVFYLFISILIYTFIYCISIWIIALNRNEKAIIIGKFRNLRGEKK